MLEMILEKVLRRFLDHKGNFILKTLKALTTCVIDSDLKIERIFPDYIHKHFMLNNDFFFITKIVAIAATSIL